MKRLVPLLFFILSIAFLVAVYSWKFKPAKAVQISDALSAEKLTALVNKWRVESGFQMYEKNEALCKISDNRVNDGIDYHKGLYDKYSKYPSYIAENSTEVYETNESALNEWLNSPSHKSALEKPYRYSCISTKNNFAVQIFSNCENGCY